MLWELANFRDLFDEVISMPGERDERAVVNIQPENRFSIRSIAMRQAEKTRRPRHRPASASQRFHGCFIETQFSGPTSNVPGPALSETPLPPFGVRLEAPP